MAEGTSGFYRSRVVNMSGGFSSYEKYGSFREGTPIKNSKQ